MPRRFALSCLLSAALPAMLFAAEAGEAPADWPQWRGPGRTGSILGPPLRTEAPPGGLEPLWVAADPAGSGGGWASPVVADGRVFLATAGRVKKEGVDLPPPKFPRLSDEAEAALPAAEAAEYERNRRAESLDRRRAAYTGRETLTALDAATGDVLWADDRDTPVTRFPQSSTPAVAGGTVVRLGGDRVLRALSAADGAELWQTRLPGEFDAEQISSSPAIAGDRVFVLAGALFAVGLADGAVLWESPDAAGTHSSPVVWAGADGEGAVIVNVTGGGTVAVNAADGRERWRLTETGAERSSPVVVPGAGGEPDRLLTFGGSRKGGLRCYALPIDPGSEAEPLWTDRRLSDPGASPVAAGDFVLTAGDGKLACTNLSDGAPRWVTRLDLANPRYTSPAAFVTVGEPGASAPGVKGVGLYCFGRLLAFDLTGEGFRPRFDLAAGPGGGLKTENRWRDELNIPAGAEGVREFDRQVARRGLLPCASPALANGRAYVRLEDGLACYDLTAAGGGGDPLKH